MTPFDFIDWATDLVPSRNEFRDIETDTLSAGKRTCRVWVEEYKYSARWMRESGDIIWMVWVRHSSSSQRLLGMSATEEGISAILRQRTFAEADIVYLVQYLAESP
jgi:hypothetical protein